MFHHPSPLARAIWYYVRSLGRAKHSSSFRMTPAATDGFLLHFLLRGNLWHRVREQKFVAGPGEACLMDLGEAVEYGVVGPGEAEFYWALFNGRDMARVFLELRADRSPVFGPVRVARMKACLRELMAITRRPPAAYEACASALLGSVLAELFVAHPTRMDIVVREARAMPLSETVRKGIEFISRFYDQPLPVKRIAFGAGKSLSYFSRRFHREVGMSPTDYLNQYRVEQAKKLLEASDKTIAEIARSVGFPDPGYLARVFTSIVGKSPLVYRKNPRPS